MLFYSSLSISTNLVVLRTYLAIDNSTNGWATVHRGSDDTIDKCQIADTDSSRLQVQMLVSTARWREVHAAAVDNWIFWV